MKLSYPILLTAALLATLVAAPAGKPAPAIVTLQNCTLTPRPLTAPHHRSAAAPRVRNKDGTSSNWGGYAVQTSLTSPQRNAVSAVQGTWIVPAVTPSGSATTYSSFWVGIDGYSDNTVEQIGTEQDWTPSGPQYSVWFEMYPRNSYNITGFPIQPGDLIAASVIYLNSGVFTLSITNLTRHVAYTVPAKNTKLNSAQRESAEWIAEAPWSGGVLPLADFGKATFTNCTTTINGFTGPIDSGRWQADPIDMAANGVTKAHISGVTDSLTGSAFSVQWLHE